MYKFVPRKTYSLLYQEQIKKYCFAYFCESKEDKTDIYSIKLLKSAMNIWNLW